MSVSRRTFIRSASLAAAGSAAGLRPFGTLNALAQSASGYKALVCVFLYGGNDANNTLIQFDTNGYANYSSVRGPLALPQSQLLQLSAAPNLRSTLIFPISRRSSTAMRPPLSPTSAH